MKRSTLIAWLLAGFILAGSLINLAFWLPQGAGQWQTEDWVSALGWQLLVPIVFGVVGALIIARQPANRVGWLMMLPAVVGAIPIGSGLQLDVPPTAFTPMLWLLVWFDGWSWIPSIFSIFLIPLHFPTGRPPSPRWNWVNRLAIGMGLFFILFTAFFAGPIGPLYGTWTLPNPIGFIPFDRIEGAFLIIWGLGLVTMLAGSVASLIVRFRRARSGERQQIKWLLYAGAIFLVVYTFTYFYSDSDFSGAGLINFLFLPSILAIPVAIAISILRYRLYDIDIIIRRTLQYSLITGLLAIMYFGSIVILQNLFFGSQQSEIVIVFSTLGIAALFTPLRRRVQDFIDRRFYRKKYDAEQALANFAITARDEVDMDKLAAALIGVVEETMQPESVSLWLTGDR